VNMFEKKKNIQAYLMSQAGREEREHVRRWLRKNEWWKGKSKVFTARPVAGDRFAVRSFSCGRGGRSPYGEKKLEKGKTRVYAVSERKAVYACRAWEGGGNRIWGEDVRTHVTHVVQRAT